MKKLINSPDQAVTELLEGLALVQPGLALLEDRTIAVRADRVVTDDNRSSVPVAVISGGGAGHEPAHAGYVADGMLTAAISGEVFASPSVDAVLDGIRAVTGDAGCLLIVKSYTGDRLNFGLAAQMARAEGLDVEMVVVADDVALSDEDDNAGRRGLAGTVLVHKTAGAVAARGGTLAEVTDAARRVAGSVGTMGVGLTPCIVPANGKPGFELAEDEMELGLGIHGEPGVSRERMRPADDVAAEMIDRIVGDRELSAGDRVVLLVGDCGGTSAMEINIMARAAHRRLSDSGIIVERVWQGPVMTSLEMAGASVSVLGVDDELLGLLDAPTASLAWPGSPGAEAPQLRRVPVPPTVQDHRADAGTHDEAMAGVLQRVCERLLEVEDELTALDREVGDGDLGQALSRGARAWLASPVEGDAATQLRGLSACARRDIGGTSGPLYAAGLWAAAEALGEGADWPSAFHAGAEALMELGGARPGDRTMVDALQPAAEASASGLDAALSAAETGARETADVAARRGRSSYLGDRAKGHPDPGAVAVVRWLEAIRG